MKWGCGYRYRATQAVSLVALIAALTTFALTIEGPSSSIAAAARTHHCGESGGLNAAGKKSIAMKLVSSAENSTLNWRA